MADHRIRLSDSDIAIIVAALQHSYRVHSARRAARMLALAERLAEGGRGNPRWRFESTAELRAAREPLKPGSPAR